MNDIDFIIEEVIEGGYIAKAIGHSIFTEANSIEELENNIIEAVECHFDIDTNSKKSTVLD